MNIRKNKRLYKILLIITIIIIGWVISQVITNGFNVVSQQYGIDPQLFFIIIVVCEVAFDIGIILMLLGSGILKVKLKHILKMDFTSLVFENKLVHFGFTINRIAALIPPLYLLLWGFGKLPLLIVVLVIVELAIVLIIATLPFELKKFFGFWKDKRHVYCRVARIEDAQKISELESKVWAENAATLSNIRNRLDTFAEGNLLAIENDEIVGYVCIVPVSQSLVDNSKTWYDYTDNGDIKAAYDPEGKLFFGVNLTVSNKCRNLGIGSKLLLQIARTAVRKRYRLGILGGRLPYYYKHKNLSPEDYVNLKDEKNRIYDPELRLYVRMGLKVVKVQKDYFHDPESLNYGVILEWKNPFFRITEAFPFISYPLSQLFRI